MGRLAREGKQRLQEYVGSRREETILLLLLCAVCAPPRCALYPFSVRNGESYSTYIRTVDYHVVTS